jgi:Helix-turn-helix domain
MTPVHPARHLLRAKDLIDARYREPLDVRALARTAHFSPAHFSREFRRAFGETSHQYLLTRQLERAAALLRNTDYTIADLLHRRAPERRFVHDELRPCVRRLTHGPPSRAPARWAHAHFRMTQPPRAGG